MLVVVSTGISNFDEIGQLRRIFFWVTLAPHRCLPSELMFFFVVACLEPLIVIELGEYYHLRSPCFGCSACFSYLSQFPQKSNNAMPSAIFLRPCYWFNNLHKIFCKTMKIFWIDLPFATFLCSLPPTKLCVCFGPRHCRNPMLKFLEPLAAEHGMIFTLQKGHLVWFQGVVGGCEFSCCSKMGP